jgi:hypothetical protein
LAHDKKAQNTNNKNPRRKSFFIVRMNERSGKGKGRERAEKEQRGTKLKDERNQTSTTPDNHKRVEEINGKQKRAVDGLDFRE